MRIAIAIALVTYLGLITGCASSERVYANVYEGLKMRNAMINPSVERKPAEKSLSYQEYQAERKKLLESNN